MKILKKKYDLLKDELKSSQNKNEALERDHIALVKEISDKPLDECEMALQKFIITGLNRTKLTSMIYGVSRRKGDGLGYFQKPFNPRSGTMIKPIEPYFSSYAQIRLDSYFVPTTDKAKVLNQ